MPKKKMAENDAQKKKLFVQVWGFEGTYDFENMPKKS